MEASSIIEAIVLLALLVLSAFFSSAETALTTVSAIRIKTLAEEGNKKAETVEKVISDPHKMLSAILIGNNIVNLSASSLATTLAVHLLGSYGAGIATGILTFLILIFGEITPKTMANLHAEKISMRYAGVIWYLMWILTPIIVIVNFLSTSLMRLLGVSKEDAKFGLTAKEIKNIVEDSHESGALEVDERNMIYQFIDFQESYAKEIMIPKIDMTTVDESSSFEQIMEAYERDKYTRMPVLGTDKEEIFGILNMKNLLSYNRKDDFHIKDYMQEAFYTYEMKKTSELFDQMRRGHISLAIVLDEYGSVVGMVSFEDLLEELVGEIRDEFDDDEEDDLIQINENTFEALGTTNLEDLMHKIRLDISSEDYDTLGGFLIGEFNHFPEVGEMYLTPKGARFKVIEIDGNRITKVQIRLAESVPMQDDLDLNGPPIELYEETSEELDVD